ncbi:MAG: polyamine aminopropyltransferase [Sulfurihydrogenibium sp.]|uniref:polyamine aminopropyltransferase n=1 Tax=Sulfurihydrogenibium sp. TaxID=2053621 RepID=UPI003D138854
MIWFTEYQTKNTGLTVKVKEAKHIQSKYQEILLLDTYEYGKMLVLDGAVQTTERDEFIYHEMLSHPALIKHRNPERVLVIGGGDGGTVREVLKHPEVKQVHLCEIDEEVIKVSKEHLPTISNQLDNPKVSIFVEDGNKFLDERKSYYDVILLDLSDPVGPAEALFKRAFYEKVKGALREGGIMAAQTESPFLQELYFKTAVKEIQKVFKYYGTYLAFIPTYPAGMWSFTIASDDVDVTKTDGKELEKLKNLNTKYFCDKIYTSLFSLPKFVSDLIK